MTKFWDVVGYVFGVIFLISGLGLMTDSAFGGLLICTGGALLLPPVQKNVMRFEPKLNRSAFVIASIVLIVWGSPKNKYEPQESPDQKPVAVNSTPMEAHALAIEYFKNELNAEEKYQGQVMLLNGIVLGVERGVLGGAVIKLASYNEFMPIHANGDSEAFLKIAKQSQMGSRIKIKCMVGAPDLGIPTLHNCDAP